MTIAKNELPHRSPAGARIRAMRLEKGMTQAELAQSAGISASYLNLLERDRRRITPRRLADLAALLGTTAEWLGGRIDDHVMQALAAAGAPPGEPVSAFVARFPGWAQIMADQAERTAELAQRDAAQAIREARDPAVAAALHQIITSASAIQSGSSILVGGELDADWRDRFQRNVHDDSQRLSQASTALLHYLEARGGAFQPGPVEEIVQWIRRHGPWCDVLRGLRPQDVPGFGATAQLSAAGATMLEGWLAQALNDAERLDAAQARGAYDASGGSPVAMAQAQLLPLPLVLRRLAMLSGAQDQTGLWPEMGLAVCDAAGVLRFLAPIPGFNMPDTGGCPLWPLYEALAMPGRAVQARVLPAGGAQLSAVAVAHDRQVRPGAPPLLEATMLVMNAAEAEAMGAADPATSDATAMLPRPVGLTCRQCAEAACAARREPQVDLKGLDAYAPEQFINQ